jgi:hypothetical protein
MKIPIRIISERPDPTQAVSKVGNPEASARPAAGNRKAKMKPGRKSKNPKSVKPPQAHGHHGKAKTREGAVIGKTVASPTE